MIPSPIIRPPVATLVTVGALSFVLLGFQVSLMRILSYAQWYHFASLIISVALLGFGGAGTALALARRRITGREARTVQIASLVCLLTVAGAPLIVSWLPVDPFLLLTDAESVVHLLVLIGALIVPFFSGALVIGMSFVLHPTRIAQFYCANLLGSALGGIGAVAILELVLPGQLPPVLALLAVVPVWASTKRSWRESIIACGLAASLAYLIVWHNPGIPMSQFKPLARALMLPGSRITERATNPLGVLETVEGRSLRYAPGLSLMFGGDIPPQDVVFHDGEWIGPLIRPADSLVWPVYEHSTSLLPYCLTDPMKVLIVGAGTGSEVLLAVRRGAGSAIGVEMNPELVETFNRVHRPKAHWTGASMRAEMVRAEARSYLVRDTGSYGLIVVPILEGQTANATGTHALFENYLLTIESFSLMVRRLEATGVIAIHTWMNTPPRGSIKVLGTLIEALRSNGVENPGDHLAVIRSWNTVAVAASRQPLTNAQIQRVRRFSKDMGFDLVWLPGIAEEETNVFHQLDHPWLFDASRAMIDEQAREFARAYPFRIEPATDDRPYFSNFISWGNLPRLLQAYRSREVPYLELGTFFLVLTAAYVIVLSLGVIGVPLVLLRKGSVAQGLLPRSLIYFGGLGLGYMILEMVLIQKTVLFLGDPVYSVALVVGSLLFSSSLGSALSPSLKTVFVQYRWRLPWLLVVVVAFYVAVLSPLLSAMLSMPDWARFLLFPLVVAPLGVVLGIPFPLGLSHLAERAPRLVPLAWGMNGCCSVVASSTAVLASMELGFGLLQLLAVVAYAGAFLVFPAVRPDASRTHG